MHILVISDIHANLTALEAVLADAGEVEAVWCLGDLVGYGPNPNECIELVRELPSLKCILGNHDAAALGQIDSDTFNPEARAAIHWTQTMLSDASRVFLESLDEKVVIDDVTLAHGSPRHPVWEYLLDSRTATQSFDHFDTDYCFVGHTHLPVVYTLFAHQHVAHLLSPEPDVDLPLEPRAILNPGSVGQPRDRDPRASYAIFDDEACTWRNRRVPYDITAVQARMVAAGLPSRHIQRLTAGW
jgi:predicted phosphodiesterase